MTLTDRERLALRRVALPTLLGALTLHEVARECGVAAIAREGELAQALIWLHDRKGPGQARARRVYRTRAIRALMAAQALDDAIGRASVWAAQFAREMSAVHEAEADYTLARSAAPVQW